MSKKNVENCEVLDGMLYGYSIMSNPESLMNQGAEVMSKHLELEVGSIPENGLAHAYVSLQEFYAHSELEPSPRLFSSTLYQRHAKVQFHPHPVKFINKSQARRY